MDITCVLSLDGDPAFVIRFNQDTNITQLKEHIYQKRPKTLSSVDPDVLKLYLIQSDPSAMKEVEGTSTLPDNHIKLSNPMMTFSEYLGRQDHKAVYVFVSFTPPQPVAQHADALHKIIETLNDNLNKKNAELETLNANLNKKIAELETIKTYHMFKLIVVPKRTQSLNWAANPQTASLNELKAIISNAYFPDIQSADLEITVNQTSASKTSLHSDLELRIILRQSILDNNMDIKISVETPTKAFSSYTVDRVRQIYDVDPVHLPKFNCGHEALTNPELKSLLNKMLYLKCFTTPITPGMSPEATPLLYVHDFLSIAAAEFGDLTWDFAVPIPDESRIVVVKPQDNITGNRGNGPVDYAIELRNDITVGVTEVKRGDNAFPEGIAQNMVQIETVLSKKRKRSVDDIDSTPMARSFGIVTNAKDWYFLECTYDEGKPKFRQSARAYEVSYKLASAIDTILDVAGAIKWLFKQALSAHEGTDAPERRKRVKIGSNVAEEQVDLVE